MPALNHFRRMMTAHFDDVVCIASKAFPANTAHENNFARSFTFLYNRYIPVMVPSLAAEKIANHAAYDQSSPDPYEKIAVYEANQILTCHAASADDVVFFPGADFYGIAGFLNALEALTPTNRPQLYIRLIGVLEASSQFYDDPASELYKRVKIAIARGVRVSISAETPDYANDLAERIGVFTQVTPYPETASQLPLPDTNDFTVLCAGSARLDKGFHFLRDIMLGISALPSRRKIKLVTQCLPPKGSEAWDAYTSQLYAMRNVTLLEAVLDSETMGTLYRNCDLVLLPYAPDVYKMRGSAVMMEAASIGRQCVTLKGTAFAKQVEFYGLGYTVNSIEDVPAAVHAVAETSRELLSSRITQARTRFYMDVSNSYKTWFNFQ